MTKSSIAFVLFFFFMSFGLDAQAQRMSFRTQPTCGSDVVLDYTRPQGQNGVVNLQYKLDNGEWIAVQLDAGVNSTTISIPDGHGTITVQDLSHGSAPLLEVVFLMPTRRRPAPRDFSFQAVAALAHR